MIFLWDSLCLSAVTLSRQWHDILDFSNCPLSRVLHVTLANWQGFGFEFHLRSSPYMNISRPAEYFIVCYTVLKRPNKATQLSTVAILGFQFGLYHVTAPLSFLRSISLASLFAILSIFGWLDLLQILRLQAAFSFAVLFPYLCIIMFYCLFARLPRVFRRKK